MKLKERLDRNTTDGMAFPSTSTPVPPTPRQQRKEAGTRAWLVVQEDGRSEMVELGRYAVMQRTGITARDLRILVPTLSYPSTVLGRERAIVVKLEHINAIITATEVLVANSKDPLVSPFVDDLLTQVSGGPDGVPLWLLLTSIVPPELGFAQASFDEPSAWFSEAPGNYDTDIDASIKFQHGSSSPDHTSAHPSVMVTSQQLENSSPPLGSQGRSSDPMLDISNPGSPKALPFEFRALEVCFECACKCIESEAFTLEQEAYPVLDELTSKISTLNLERLRQIKSRLVVISGCIQRVRDEIEHLLDDEVDMAGMYLTTKLAGQQSETSSSVDAVNDTVAADEERNKDSKDSRDRNDDLSFVPNTGELEMLLEAYLVQTERTLNKLSALRESVEDTEDYMKMMMDEKQNQLLEMGVVVSTATLILTAGVVVVGVLGINIHIPIYESNPVKFWETTAGLVTSLIILFVTAMVWGKKSRLLSC